jgi:hypothetical protein
MKKDVAAPTEVTAAFLDATTTATAVPHGSAQ